jgi:hypothetical protein
MAHTTNGTSVPLVVSHPAVDVTLRTMIALRRLDADIAAECSTDRLAETGPQFTCIHSMMIIVHTRLDDLMMAVRTKREVPGVVPTAAIELAAALIKMAGEFDTLLAGDKLQKTQKSDPLVDSLSADD